MRNRGRKEMTGRSEGINPKPRVRRDLWLAELVAQTLYGFAKPERYLSAFSCNKRRWLSHQPTQ